MPRQYVFRQPTPAPRFLTDEQAEAIRKEYKAGVRGKARAAYYKISGAYFNSIGRGQHRAKSKPNG